MRKPIWVVSGPGRLRVFIVLLFGLSLLGLTGSLRAQEKPAVQQLTGYLELNENAFFVLRHLKKGQTLYLFAEGTSGDFDPVIALLKPEVDFARAGISTMTGGKFFGDGEIWQYGGYSIILT